MVIRVTYDVSTSAAMGAKRLRRVDEECVNYGQRVQNSVCEGWVSEDKFEILKSKIEAIINHEQDSIRFYFLGKNWESKIIMIGRETSFNMNSELII